MTSSLIIACIELKIIILSCSRMNTAFNPMMVNRCGEVFKSSRGAGDRWGVIELVRFRLFASGG